MLFKPLANSSTLDRRNGVLRGGALEPGALAVSGKCAGKSRGLFSSEFCCAERAEEPFSLRRGLEFNLGISAEHHLSKSEFQDWENEKGDPVGSPSLEAVMRLNRVSAQTSQRGLDR